MEFSKPSKPRVWYTRPWSPSASVKPLSHSGCRENRTNKHSYHLKVNFAELGSNTLGQYSTFELGLQLLRLQ
ncbi:putative histone deacetylase complex subunit SAP30/SAP30 [Helianthus annuus]|nr:putative histone deacetylase complex subunit SAP30/SAP30 [Helianthus annuus]